MGMAAGIRSFLPALAGRVLDLVYESGLECVNNSGGTFTKGTLVYVSSFHAGFNRPQIAKADATDATKSAFFVVMEDCLTAHKVVCQPVAFIGGLATNGRTIGDAVYLSGTPGGIVFATTGIGQRVGTVATVSATNGYVFFNVAGGAITGVSLLASNNAWTGTNDYTGALTATDEEINVDVTMTHATQIGVPVDATFTQLTNARTAGYGAAYRAKTTSLAGDLNGVPYTGLYVLAPTDGGGAVLHSGLYVEAGNDYTVHGLDNVRTAWGTGAAGVADATMGWDATSLTLLPSVDDSVYQIGNGTLSFDVQTFGNLAGTYKLWDASLDTDSYAGPVRTSGLNVCSRRYELKWTAGQRGVPAINADISAVVDPDFELLGTNAVTADLSYYVEGGITLITHGGATDTAILAPHLDAGQSGWNQVTWGTDKQTVWEAHISTAAAITTMGFYAGLKLTNTNVVATDNDQVFFRYEAGVNSGKIQVISSIGNTDTSTDSAITVTTATEYHFKVVIASNRTAKCYINGALIYTTAALTDATDFIPYIGVFSVSVASAKSIKVFGQNIGRTIG